jgi:hypothetical protein
MITPNIHMYTLRCEGEYAPCLHRKAGRNYEVSLSFIIGLTPTYYHDYICREIINDYRLYGTPGPTWTYNTFWRRVTDAPIRSSYWSQSMRNELRFKRLFTYKISACDLNHSFSISYMEEMLYLTFLVFWTRKRDHTKHGKPPFDTP